jgi:hypothetical protein
MAFLEIDDPAGHGSILTAGRCTEPAEKARGELQKNRWVEKGEGNTGHYAMTVNH